MYKVADKRPAGIKNPTEKLSTQRKKEVVKMTSWKKGILES